MDGLIDGMENEGSKSASIIHVLMWDQMLVLIIQKEKKLIRQMIDLGSCSPNTGFHGRQGSME